MTRIQNPTKGHFEVFEGNHNRQQDAWRGEPYVGAFYWRLRAANRQIVAMGGGPRQVAYLLAWSQGPKLALWVDVRRFDAIDLVVDACAEGFDAYLAHSEA